jgi:hypothetical protein
MTGAHLRYVGNGAGLYNVPARDIPAAELDHYDGVLLVASGLYEVVIEEAAAAPALETPAADSTEEGAL